MIKLSMPCTSYQFPLQVSNIDEVKPVETKDFPEVKSQVFYAYRKKWMYSTETPEEIQQKIEEDKLCLSR